MTNYKYKQDNQLLTDEAIIGELGEKMKQARLKMNMTQTQLADECRVAKRTIERFEHGASIQLTSFVRIIRALSHIDSLLGIIPDQVRSPMAILREDETRYRATGTRKTKKDDERNKPWEWGE